MAESALINPFARDIEPEDGVLILDDSIEEKHYLIIACKSVACRDKFYNS
jgi:hypothetical protein